MLTPRFPQVIIGGQGSGADMVAYHLLGYGAKSDGLFRGAILHSGSATGRSPIPRPNYTEWQSHYDAIVSATRYVLTVSTSQICADFLVATTLPTLGPAFRVLLLIRSSKPPARFSLILNSLTQLLCKFLDLHIAFNMFLIF